MLPQDTKQYSLHTIREDLGFEATEHETGDSRLGNNFLNNLGIRDLRGVGLLVNLADANGIGAGVTDGRGTEANDRPSAEFGQLVVLLGDLCAQHVVGKEPGVVAHKGGRGGSQSSVVQSAGSGFLDLVGDSREFSGHLHRSL